MDLVGATLLGKYRIEGRLGEGGMCTVFEGLHLGTNRRVAVKVLDERFVKNANVVKRFGREARAASAVHHPGIVDILDHDTLDGVRPFLVMEYLDGETLGSRLEKRVRLDQDSALAVMFQLLDALDAAHAHGVIHRDLKPENIFLVPIREGGERVKILDFGISRKADEVLQITVEGSVLGTPHYMAPEQARGELDLDARCDIYALGVVLYECVVGETPFDAENYNKLMQLILHEQPTPPRARGANISGSIERIILSTLAKDREERPSSAKELRDRLRVASMGTSTGPQDVSSLSRSGVNQRAVATMAIEDGDVPSVNVARVDKGKESAFALSDLDIAEPAPRVSSPTPIQAPVKSGASFEDDMSGPSLALDIDEKPLPPRRVAADAAAQSGAFRAIDAKNTSGTFRARDGRPGAPEPDMRKTSPNARSTTGRGSLGPHTGAQAARVARFEDNAQAAEPARSGSPVRMVAMVLAAIVCIVGGTFALRFIASKNAEQHAPVAAPTHETTEVWIDVSGVPRGARIQLDGIPVHSLPLRVRRGSVHTLEVRDGTAPPQIVRFEANEDQRLSLAGR